MIPFEIIYCRKTDRDLRSSIVAVPIFIPNSKVRVNRLKKIVGLCIHAHRVVIPYSVKNLSLSDFESRILIHYLHQVATDEFQQKYPWRGISNVHKKEIKQAFENLVIRGKGTIQIKVNQFFASFLAQLTASPPREIAYESSNSVNLISNVYNDYGYHYFTVYLDGSIEVEETLAAAANSAKQLTAIPASFDRVISNDKRLITFDSEVRSMIQRSFDEYFEDHYYQRHAMHMTFPWLKDFLLTYLSQCLQSISSTHLNIISEVQFKSKIQQGLEFESIQSRYKPNTMMFKDSLIHARKQNFFESIQTKESVLSQIIQMMLSQFDPIPMNRSELSLFNSSIETTTFNTDVIPPLQAEIERRKLSLIAKKRKRKSDTGKQEWRNEESFSQFLPSLESNEGDPSIILSKTTQRKTRLARLLALSKSCHSNQINPIRSIRNQEKRSKERKSLPSFYSYFRDLSNHIKSNEDDTRISDPNKPIKFTGSVGDRMTDTDYFVSNLFQEDWIEPFADSSVKSSINRRLPSQELMTWVRELFVDKMNASLTSESSRPFHQIFEETALSSIAIFIEESIYELISLWQRGGHPLLFSKKTLKSEVFSQMNGVTDPYQIDANDLQKRLEILFGRSLKHYSSYLKERRKEFLETYESKFIHLSSHNKNLTVPMNQVDQPEYVAIPSQNRMEISLREREVEEKDPSFPLLTDAKRQIVGDKRKSFDSFPSYITDYKPSKKPKVAKKIPSFIPHFVHVGTDENDDATLMTEDEESINAMDDETQVSTASSDDDTLFKEAIIGQNFSRKDEKLLIPAPLRLYKSMIRDITDV